VNWVDDQGSLPDILSSTQPAAHWPKVAVTLTTEPFRDKWFEGRISETERATGPVSWQRIVKELSKYSNVKLVNFIEYLYE
jgi:hypothetical protein